MKPINENRREFLSRAAIGAFSIPLLLGCRKSSLAQSGNQSILDLVKKNAETDSTSNWTGAIDAKKNTSWNTSLANSKEKGEQITIRGTVYKSDGKTPAPNVLIYTYHTDIQGLYGQGGNHNHGRFRGWMLTDRKGRYKFSSVKPGSYPSRNNPAHIHMTITTAEQKEYWIDSILFEGDRLISTDMRIVKRGGFNPILSLKRNSDGFLAGVRNIQLLEI